MHKAFNKVSGQSIWERVSSNVTALRDQAEYGIVKESQWLVLRLAYFSLTCIPTKQCCQMFDSGTK